MATYSLTWTGVSTVAMARLIRMANKAGMSEPVVSIDGIPKSFTISLADVGPNKIPVIKAIRELTGMGLKDAKDVTEIEPRTVERDCTPARVEVIRNALVNVGATVRVS